MKDNLSSVVKESLSFNDVCRRVGMSESHGNWSLTKFEYRNLQEWVDYFDRI